ncbi:MAG: hypothetical protein J7L03_07755 [Caldisericaceae bacterium]|nr:hypothetical protein [Caldisericaceae bacterium]
MDEEVDLRDYINVLIKWKKMIIGITILAMLVAGVMSYFVLPKTYEATGSLLVNPKEAKVNISTPEQLLNPLTFLPQISVNTYTDIIKNKSLESKVISDLGLQNPPYNITIDQFDKMISVENPKNTTIIKVTTDFTDPEIAQKITETVLKRAVELIDEINKSKMSASVKNLAKQFELAKSNLESAEKAIADFNSQKDNITNLKQKRNAYYNALNSYLSQLLSLDYQIEQYKKQLASVKEQLKTTDKYLVTQKSILDEPLISQLATSLANANIADLSQLKVNSQQINPVYEDLSAKKSNYTITLSGLEAKKSSLLSLEADIKDKIHKLDEEINSKQLQLDELNRQLNIAQTRYNKVFSNYQQSLLANENMLSPVSIIDVPVVPTRPVKPKKLFNIAVSGVAAFFFAVLLAFFLEYWRGKGDDKKKIKTDAA